MNCDNFGNVGLQPSASPGVDEMIVARLRALHDEYAAAVNAALDEGRDELVAQLADEFSEEALRMISAAPRAA